MPTRGVILQRILMKNPNEMGGLPPDDESGSIPCIPFISPIPLLSPMED